MTSTFCLSSKSYFIIYLVLFINVDTHPVLIDKCLKFFNIGVSILDSRPTLFFLCVLEFAEDLSLSIRFLLYFLFLLYCHL